MSSLGASPRMYENNFLDSLTRTRWWMIPVLYVPYATALFAYGVWSGGVALLSGLGLAVSGWFIWTLTEYGLHRTLFHWIPSPSWGARFHFLLHGVHHDHPKDLLRLVIPPVFGLPSTLLFVVLFMVVFGVGPGACITAGFLCGYVAYDVIHYATHSPTVKIGALKALRVHHIQHHFSTPERRFGVSTRMWDRVFGTL